MKQGKRPTMAQKIRIKSYKLNPNEWMVSVDCTERFVIVHRVSGEVRTLKLKEECKCKN